LIDELRSLTGTVKLLVTSRRLLSIEQHFRNTKRVDIQVYEQDVRRYIEDRIPREPQLRLQVKEEPALQEIIEGKIIAKVQSMYVLLAFM
jgi:hypothetical protein